MGKAIKHTIAAEQEFSKLQMLLVRSAPWIILPQHVQVFHEERHSSGQGTTVDLRHVAKRIKRSKNPTKSEINAARISMNATADAMNDLKQAGRILTRTMEYREVSRVSSTISSTKRGLFGSKNSGYLKAPDTLQRFSALKQQITATENAMSPSIATRAKDAVVNVASKLVGDSSSSPTRNSVGM
ncbi:hypothetical protein GQ600_1792 [Phytophthora cactorum]|nr:hypothetical protein GQ600_1792 [Phytophthora cactorum]